MGIDFRFYLNRQGIQGKRGERGEQGFSPLISVKTQTANEYVLTVQNEDGSFDTPNLRGNAIANNGGTYIRYNPVTEEMYTGDADYATNEQAGVVLLASYEQLIAGGSENLIPTSEDVYNFVTQQIVSGFVTQQEFDSYTAATAITLNNLATQKLSFADLASALVEGENITLDVDSENHTITINAAGGDLTNYVTLDTEQTLTAKKTSNLARSGSNMIYNVEFKGGHNASLKIGSAKGSSSSDNDIPVIIGNKLRIGTTDSNLAPNFVCPSSSSLPSIGIFDITNTGVVVTDATWHPIFSDLNVEFGTGLNVATSGAGMSKKYTISATAPDLSNYMTLDTVQTITARKLFATIYNTNNRNLVSYDSNNTANRIGNTTDVLDLSGYNVRPTYTAYNQQPVSLALLSDIPSNTITLTSLSIDNGSTNYLEYDNTTGQFSAKASATPTNNGTDLITTGGVYANTVSGVAAHATDADKFTVTKAGSNTTITINDVAHATKADQDGNGDNIASTYATKSEIANFVELTDLSVASTSANYLAYNNNTGEFGAKVDTTVTQNSSKLVTSGAVYDAIQSSVGNIETLLNNINSGSGS